MPRRNYGPRRPRTAPPSQLKMDRLLGEINQAKWQRIRAWEKRTGQSEGLSRQDAD